MVRAESGSEITIPDGNMPFTKKIDVLEISFWMAALVIGFAAMQVYLNSEFSSYGSTGAFTLSSFFISIFGFLVGTYANIDRKKSRGGTEYESARMGAGIAACTFAVWSLFMFSLNGEEKQGYWVVDGEVRYESSLKFPLIQDLDFMYWDREFERKIYTKTKHDVPLELVVKIKTTLTADRLIQAEMASDLQKVERDVFKIFTPIVEQYVARRETSDVTRHSFGATDYLNREDVINYIPTSVRAKLRAIGLEWDGIVYVDSSKLGVPR